MKVIMGDKLNALTAERKYYNKKALTVQNCKGFLLMYRLHFSVLITPILLPDQ